MPIGWCTIVSFCDWVGIEVVDADGQTGLNNWLINAFNGEWLRTEDAVPLRSVDVSPRVR